jgi:hypothetical protein
LTRAPNAGYRWALLRPALGLFGAEANAPDFNMADEGHSASPERAASSRSRVDPPATRAQARARVRAATGTVGPDLAAAAARAVAELHLGFANRSAQIGLLDDVVDFAHGIVQVAADLLTFIIDGPVNDVPGITPGVTDVTQIVGGAASQPGQGSVEVKEPQPGASARQLLETRQAIVDATARQSKALDALAESLRAQIAAMRRPKA